MLVINVTNILPRYLFRWFSFLTLPRCKHDGSFMALYQTRRVIGHVYVYIKRFLWCLRFWFEFWDVLTCKYFYFWFPFYYHYFSCPSRGVGYHFLIRSEILLRHICFRLSMFCGQKIYFYYMGISGESGILKHGTFLPETRQTPTGIFMI